MVPCCCERGKCSGAKSNKAQAVITDGDEAGAERSGGGAIYNAVVMVCGIVLMQGKKRNFVPMHGNIPESLWSVVCVIEHDF